MLKQTKHANIFASWHTHIGKLESLKEKQRENKWQISNKTYLSLQKCVKLKLCSATTPSIFRLREYISRSKRFISLRQPSDGVQALHIEFIFAGDRGRRKSICCLVCCCSQHNLTVRGERTSFLKARHGNSASLTSLWICLSSMSQVCCTISASEKQTQGKVLGSAYIFQ